MENNNTTAIIILLIIMLAAFFLGWIIARFMNKITTEDNDITDQIAQKEAELEACQSENAALSQKQITEVVIAAIPTMDEAPEAIIDTITENNRKDDLKIVEGIGPKIEELLHNSGILSYFQLSNTTVEKLKEILQTAGPRYQMHDPTTWPQQSKLAYNGMWNELKIGRAHV